MNERKVIIKGSRIDIALQLLPEKGDKLLDIGCGSGKLCKIVASMFEDVCGVDKKCEEAHKNLREIENVHISVVNLDTDFLPYPCNTFDAVTCLDVLEHVHDPNFVVVEVLRVLKDDGVFVLTVPNIRYWLHLLRLAVKGKFPVTSDDVSEWDGGHIHYFTFQDIRDLLQCHGFVVERERGAFGHDSFLRTVTSPGVVIKGVKKK